MNPHDLMVVFTGLCFLLASMALAVTGRLLAPDFSGNITVRPKWRFAFWLMSGVAALRALTLLFPADLVAVELMSVIMPLEAAGFLGLAVIVLNYVMADRAPPPLVERIMRMAGVRLTDNQVIDLTLALPVVEHATTAPYETEQDRRFRLRMAWVGFVTVLMVAGSVIWNSPVWGV